jgi:ABC-type Fe3+ transport system substrate-binding protein
MHLSRVVLCAIVAVCAAWTSHSDAASPELIKRAQAEGEVVWYSTKTLDYGIRPIAKAFEAKYGIKVKASKHTADDLVLKVLNEGRSGRKTVDVFDGSSAITAAVDAGLIAPYAPEEARALAPEYKDPKGHWTASNAFVAGIAYNTNLVRPNDLPKTANDLLEPRFAGRKIAYTTTYTLAGINGFVGGLLREMGEEKTVAYLKRLRASAPVGIDAAPSAVADRLASGEFALCIGCLNTQVMRLKEKGAPVEFLNVPPVVTFVSADAIMKNAPHPNAARLFLEFIFSPEGQTTLEQGAYLATRADISSKYSQLKPGPKTFNSIVFGPEAAKEGLPKWKSIFDATLR